MLIRLKILKSKLLNKILKQATFKNHKIKISLAILIIKKGERRFNAKKINTKINYLKFIKTVKSNKIVKKTPYERSR